ncbi:MAG: glucosamine-6-phosphate deaminase [Bacteroidetes bacterium]|nr:MAG: glucosamine-6-phosphate deaminase [Bacteroidota bacterium]
MICVHICESRENLGFVAARMVAARIKDLLYEKDFVNIMFAAAPSQNEFLARLKSEPVDWSRVRAFHMDEYIGLPKDSEKSFASYLKTRLSNYLPALKTFYIDDQNGNSECSRYGELLDEFPTDITCMGIGENNHLAFNDPPVANFDDPEKVKVVDLDIACRQQQINDGCFQSIDQVPKQAITVTIPLLTSSSFIFCMVPGQRKAKAVFETIYGHVSEAYPSTILQKTGRVELFLDKESSSLL